MTINVKKHVEKFAEEKISLAEWFVLSSVGQGPIPKNEIAQIALDQSIGDLRVSTSPVTLSQCQDAFEVLISKGMLEVVTDESLKLLCEKSKQIPIYGFPNIGDVDFTENGAALFFSLTDKLYGFNWFSEAEEINDEGEMTAFYSLTESQTKLFIERNPNVSFISESIGEWCIYWWNSFASGFRVREDKGEK